MAHIQNFKNEQGAIFNDNSLTLNAQQNNTQFNSAQNTADEPQPSTESRIRFRKGSKLIDLYRVILALHELGFFEDVSNCPAKQEDVFADFGQMLHADFSDFQKNLSQSRLCNNDSLAPTRIFDDLKSAWENYVGKHI